MHTTYLLLLQRNRSTYMGYSPALLRRLRQDNGELRGGTRRTEKGRPWVRLLVVRGFRTDAVSSPDTNVRYTTP